MIHHNSKILGDAMFALRVHVHSVRLRARRFVQEKRRAPTEHFHIRDMIRHHGEKLRGYFLFTTTRLTTIVARNRN